MGMVGKDAQNEAITRVKKAQGLIGKFLSESGVEGNADIDAFVKSHPVL